MVNSDLIFDSPQDTDGLWCACGFKKAAMEGLIRSWFRTTDGTVPHVGYRPPLPESLRKVMILVNSSVFPLF